MAVLADREIGKRLHEIFPENTANPANIRAAKYVLTLGDRLLVLPSGKRYFDEDSGPALCKGFTLKPGQTALISTRERLTMPLDLVGLIGPKFEIADDGILFLGGTLVDPGFGLKQENGRWRKQPEPLLFHIAHVGTVPHQLRPGDPIASIVFLRLDRPYKSRFTFPREFDAKTARNVREDIFDPKRSDPPDRALGLVEDFRVIRDRVDHIEASSKQVILFGVIVLAVALFTALVALVANDPTKARLSSFSWSNITDSVGLVVVEIIALIAATYLVTHILVLSRGPIRSRRRARRRRS